MIMIGTLSFSPENAKAVAEVYGNIAALPVFMKLTGPYIRGSITEGISTLSIFEFPNENSAEAVDYLKNRYAQFAQVQGVVNSLEEWLGVDIALSLLEETNSVTDALEMASFSI